MIIIGESALYGETGKYIFETLKYFLSKNNFIKEDWNALNILTQQASRVGAIDLGVHSINETENFSFFNKLEMTNLDFYIYLGLTIFHLIKKINLLFIKVVMEIKVQKLLILFYQEQHIQKKMVCL